ncbi:FAD-binding oxidoreductase [Streptomyces sp. KM273126]|uniref:FAD-binding oxidoreductase n=1 Tax=Streptomyces sp. KM273126 TaxID=2545247 RepID=UPI00103D6420|nr:FAD-binding oxidoreductase [Streptomyces sp. KM273126]MBA2812988.1 FAD-binding oxidoreductase [Streptomyces sp. KM273126]
MSPTGSTPTSPASPTHDDFPADFRGAVLRPGEDGYDQARVVFNGRAADSGPALIARCTDEDDVATALRHASARDLPVAVRGGGHGTDGHAMPGGALVLDLSGMREITVDPDTRTVRAQAGVLLGELDAAAQEHGLVVPSGTVTSTGVAGLTLGGGIGHLMRRFGATVDNLLACEMVTVDGRKVRADEKENPDLFWALRGGGGNFGVVTAFEYRAHPLGPDVVSGQIIFPGDQAAAVLAQLPAFMADAPRELGLATALTFAPPLPAMPEEAHGKLVLILIPVHTGDFADAEKTIAKLAALGTPLVNTVQRTTWLKTNSMLDATAPYGWRTNARGGYIASLTERVIDTLVQRTAASPNLPGTITAINVWSLGGAISEDAEEDATAFSRAGASWLWEAATVWTEPEHDTPYDAWADATAAAMRPHTLPNAYINLTQDQGEAWRRSVYGSEAKYQRLAGIKAVWDPRNLLRHNKNIAPAPTQ